MQVSKTARTSEFARRFRRDAVETVRKELLGRLKILEMECAMADKKLVERRVDKYDPCPCGSGMKYKWCCFDGDNNAD